MWIARDKDNELWLYSSKPHRVSGCWTSGYYEALLPEEMFPELTWDNEPVEVELKILQQ